MKIVFEGFVVLLMKIVFELMKIVFEGFVLLNYDSAFY